ncbi:hypothetical protein CLV63_104209 [Murinocardiopsis flavida]|uniref:Uncharacterized protein n=1 Tax=Murinocardiopsis flavida TaxID=645275 RepID=A0A2P8DP52_9ACTN|nr:hypothetical protein [Murinocardiopsis flavida]PSK98985.1 hypothetical protein CLV63_104209 [Murinocardiopsis flavida]
MGAFRLRERTFATREGVVYAAVDGAGRAVSVAMLSQGASADPAARDRFAAAAKRSGRVAASNTASASSWAAVRGGDARELLEAVAGEPGGAGGPSYVPYWAGASGPAAARWGWLSAGRGGGAAVDARSNKAVVVGLLMVLLLFLALLVALYFFLAQLFAEASAQPVETSPDPSSSQSQSPSQSPSPSESGPEPSQSPGGSEPPPDPSQGPSPSDVPSVPIDPEQSGDPGVPDDPSGMA